MSEDTSNGGGYDVVRAQWRGRLVPRCQVLRGGEGRKSRNGRGNELDGALESGGKGGFHRPLNLGKGRHLIALRERQETLIHGESSRTCT